MLSSLVDSIANYFKPHRTEALQRIRINAFCFVLIVVVSNLLPLPSLQSALFAATTSRWSSDSLYRWFCIIELGAAAISAFNILEGTYAVKYPRPPLPPHSSPAKSKHIFKTNLTPKRPFRVLSPNTSPQPQKPFSHSGSVPPFSPSSTYPTSPLSTPSRVVHYPDLGGSTTTSTSTMMFQTPSPVMSAYRGKHVNSVGRALDASFLSQLASDDSDYDDDRDSKD